MRTGFQLCFLSDNSQTIVHLGVPQVSLTPAHLVNGVWVLAEEAALSIRFCSELDHSFEKV